jgi:signal transduction histidine kinase
VRLPIRSKLAAALGVPVMSLVAFSGAEVVQSAADAREVREQTSLALTALGPESLVTAIQLEKEVTVVTLVGQEDAIELAVEDVDEARAQTDRGLADFRAYIEGQGHTAQAAYADALDVVDQIDDVRAQADGYDGPRELRAARALTDSVYVAYGDIIHAFYDANRRLPSAIDDSGLRLGAHLVDVAARQLDIRGNLTRALLNGQLSEGGLDTGAEFQYLGETLGAYDRYLEEIRVAATGDYGPPAESLLAVPQLNELRDLGYDAIATRQVDIGAVFAASSNAEGVGYDKFHDDVGRILRQRADELNATATSRQRWYSAGAVLVVLAAVALTWLVSRSITDPLRSLTRQATDLARHRLPLAVREVLDTPLGQDVQVPTPVPVTVRTRDEVADVARALTKVQDTAVDLAVEQAVLRRNIADSFVNLGRRNQNLLGRQLDFITELESRETEPDALDRLFRLDHLATRMRRNAESLLVLAGVEPPRKWGGPVPLTDVVRSALGEVEDYQRVRTGGIEPVTVSGSAAADLAHLMAELVENALAASPPDQGIDVRGARRLDADGYTLAVVDRGIGMSDDDVVRTNQRLSGHESFTVAPSRYLGHYVAAHLAARHGISLRLDARLGGGTTVALDLPPEILAPTPSHPGPVTMPSEPAGQWPSMADSAHPGVEAPPQPVGAPVPDEPDERRDHAVGRSVVWPQSLRAHQTPGDGLDEGVPSLGAAPAIGRRSARRARPGTSETRGAGA